MGTITKAFKSTGKAMDKIGARLDDLGAWARGKNSSGKEARAREQIMNSNFFKSALIFFIFQGSAQASTLRVACDDGAIGAEVSVNGKFKGECPVDINIAGGTIVIKATKSINGQQEIFEEKLRIGDDVTKRLEISFGALPAGSGNGATQVDQKAVGKAVAQQRYEAELAEYNHSIRLCLPKYGIEKDRLEAVVERQSRAALKAAGSDASRFGDQPGWEEYKDHAELGKKAWCERQFSTPRVPNE